MPAKFKNYRMTQTIYIYFSFYKKASNIFAKASAPIEEVSVSKTNV